MTVGRFLVTWLAMAVAMTLNGIGRELLLKRIMSGQAAAIVSAALGILLIGVITWWGFHPLAAKHPPASKLWIISIALVALTVTFETVVGRAVDHKSWPQIVEHYALWHGELWPIVLAWLAITPFVWGRGRPSSHG